MWREEEIRAKNKKKGSKRIETADLLRSFFKLQKRIQKRMIEDKSERGERELSVDYKIVDNERQEEKMCDPQSHEEKMCDPQSHLRTAVQPYRYILDY